MIIIFNKKKDNERDKRMIRGKNNGRGYLSLPKLHERWQIYNKEAKKKGRNESINFFIIREHRLIRQRKEKREGAKMEARQAKTIGEN